MRTDLTKLVIGLTGNAERFADLFNAKLPGAYRQITAQDIKDMTDCGLIGKYKYYGRTDLQIVRGLILYEQLWQKRMKKPTVEDKLQILCCKLCGDSLSTRPEGKKGRPREYCPKCESLRRKDRYRKWRIKRITLCTL
ncbi:hypothetical protein ES703_20042 [subsurface metagenome]